MIGAVLADDGLGAVLSQALPIPGDWIVQGGAVALLALVALMIFTGRLVPARTVTALERDRDQWRSVALKALGQAEVLLPAAQIATEVTRALGDTTGVRPDRAARRDDGGPRARSRS